MPEHEPLDYRLRCHTKRTDLPADVLRDIGEAYAEIGRLQQERDEARRMYCEEAFCHRFNERRFNERGGLGPITDPKQIAQGMKWDCFNTPKAKVDKTLKGVIIDGGKAVPPKYEGLGDEHL